MGRVRSTIPRSRVPIHRTLRAHPQVVRRWLLVALLAGSTGLLVARSIGAGEAARARWGDTVDVLVVAAPVGAREALADRLVTRTWPRTLVPDGALTELPDGARAATALSAGTPITTGLVEETDTAAGEVVTVAVPLGPASMALEEGDRVDLWSTVDPSLTGTGAGRGVRTERVAVGAVVLADSDERHVVVAVDDDEAEAVVEALAVATVIPAVVS